MKFENINIHHERYDYDFRVNRVKQLLQEHRDYKFALYGTGDTGNRVYQDLSELNERIIGVYDGKKSHGETINFDNGEVRVLNIDKIQQDNIKCIFCASVTPSVIDLIRARIKHLKKEGIIII